MDKSKFRIVQIGSTGKYMVEKKMWCGWRCAVWRMSMFDDYEATFATAEEAEENFQKFCCHPPTKVVKYIECSPHV